MIELSEADLAAVRRILSLHLTEGQSVWAFGSRVKGTARPWSDLDLVVKGEGPVPLPDYYRLQDAFEESEISVKVDLLDWHRISEDFRALIERAKEPVEY